MDQAWLTQNKDYLKQFKLPVEIKSWKVVLELKPVGDFTDFLQTLKNHYQENKSFNRVNQACSTVCCTQNNEISVERTLKNT